eukprot:TCONS_00040574-protein
MSKKPSEKSKSTDGGTTSGNETLTVTYEQLRTLVNDVVEKDFGPQIMKSTKDTVKAASVQSAENHSTNLAKLKKKLERKRANDNIVLKKTGHQDQFAHNTAVLETIEDTLEFMEETDVDGMKEALNKDRFWEFEQSAESISVAGKIQKFSEFWEKDLKASNFALNIVHEGYKIPFESEPPKFFAKNNASSLKNRTFVTDSITQLLKDDCIKKVDEPPHCVNPLTVAEGNSKLRLVLDLRHVNRYIKPKKFKYENLKQVSELTNKNDFLITFDLKSGYHHVPINPDFQTFLGFAWDIDGKRQYFVFKVLPFGLNIACLVFTKLMRQLVKRWRSMGIKCAMYLDDGIIGNNSYNSLITMRDLVLNDLQSAGLTVNFTKSSLVPGRTKTWLGFEINTVDMNFEVPASKIQKLLKLISQALENEFLSAREVSRIAGNLISMAIAIGPLVYLLTKQMYKFIASSFSWDKRRLINFDVIQELQFWQTNLKNVKAFRIKTKPEITKIIFSDASGTGYGGYVVEKLGNIIAKGNFCKQEIQTSSTFRELLAVKYILMSFPKLLENEIIEWFTDNDNICKIISRGSTRQHLQNLAIEIFNLCLSHNVEIYPTWIPRDMNKTADLISKSMDTDNWSIDNETFNHIIKNYGQITIDRFSDNQNAKSTVFNSREYCPGTSAVNAFSCNWGNNEFNWLCPPISLVGKTIQHLKNCRDLLHHDQRYTWCVLCANASVQTRLSRQCLCTNVFEEFVLHLEAHRLTDGKVQRISLRQIHFEEVQTCLGKMGVLGWSIRRGKLLSCRPFLRSGISKRSYEFTCNRRNIDRSYSRNQMGALNLRI